ncbi:MAG: AAA family ATPase [Myxococcales bacterium]|nr:AAA family ATPase [Myxococcales bacterium]
MSESTRVEALPAEKLRRRVDPARLQELEQSIPAPANADLVGQGRAVDALSFGLDIGVKGYNVFIVGPPGTGKTSTVLRLIRERARKESRPQDTCYVYNFDDPHRPQVLSLPFGAGAKVDKELQQSILALSRSIGQALAEEHLVHPTTAAIEKAREELHEIMLDLQKIAHNYQLDLEMEDDQFLLVPLIDGKPIEPEVFEELSPEVQVTLQHNIADFQQEAAPLIHAQREQERIIRDETASIERQAIQIIVEKTFESLLKRFSSHGKDVKHYLQGMQEYVLENYRELLVGHRQGGDQMVEPRSIREDEIPMAYRVNVLVSHKQPGAPVEFEKEPTLPHLFGYLEYQDTQQGLSADHMMIRAGSFHRANGGYLVVQADELLRSPEAWFGFKRALRHREIRMQDLWADPDKPRIQGVLRPMEVPTHLKVLLIGSVESYYALMSEDEDFRRIFKIKAEFESWLVWDEEHEVAMMRMLQRVSKEEKLLPLGHSGAALMIEESAREIESQTKISASIADSIDLLCEADHWARLRKAEEIESEDVKKALHFRNYRNEILERNIHESIRKGEMLIDTTGSVVGQINGLLVYAAVDHRFGIPTKITARTYAGQDGIINIDREANLSGIIHDKGAMILVGYLGGLFSQRTPLSFSASVTFEQIYGEIEGDSASCAELYALLSSLAQAPVSQGIAVTGSINQQGFLQPIGEVNLKIEGMFKICKERGLTGKQGVIIPVQNAGHLMLTEEVIEAVAQGQFHLWPLRHVDEGIPILMGLAAGKQSEDLTWTPGSLYQRVQKRLAHFSDIARQYKPRQIM